MRSKSIPVTTLIGCVAMCALSTVMASTTFGQKVYWTRGCGWNEILRSNLDGSCVEVLVDDAPCVIGLALDVKAGKMYWAEPIHDRIRRANLDGTEIELIVGPDDAQCAAALTLDLVHGKIYWSKDSCAGPVQIQRANLDGSCVETVVTRDDGGFGANALALDLTPSPCPLDFDCDGLVGPSDLAALLSDWGGCGGPPTDTNNDGNVDAADLAALLGQWGPCG